MNLEIYYRNAIENTFFSAFYLAQDLDVCRHMPLNKSTATRWHLLPRA